MLTTFKAQRQVVKSKQSDIQWSRAADKAKEQSKQANALVASGSASQSRIKCLAVRQYKCIVKGIQPQLGLAAKSWVMVFE